MLPLCLLIGKLQMAGFLVGLLLLTVELRIIAEEL
jgi:hypothetical protein